MKKILRIEPRTGRLKKLKETEEKILICHIQEDSFTSGSQLALMAATLFDKKVRPELCRRLLRKYNSNARVPRRKNSI
ncbi:unnamed protein product, partial [Heterotrigona itama]